jgi:hypothetical protein
LDLKAVEKSDCCSFPTHEEWEEVKKKQNIIDVEAVLKLKAKYELDMKKFWRIAQEKITKEVSRDIILKRVSQPEAFLPEKRKKIDAQIAKLEEKFNELSAEYYPPAVAIGIKSAEKITGKRVLDEKQVEALVSERLDWNRKYLKENLLRDVRRNTQFVLLENFETEEEFSLAVEKIFTSEEHRVARYASGVWGVAHIGFANEMFNQGRDKCYWITTSGRECPDCKMFATGSPYRSLTDMPAIPGDGTSVCDGYCYCVIEFKE